MHACICCQRLCLQEKTLNNLVIYLSIVIPNKYATTLVVACRQSDAETCSGCAPTYRI